MIFFFSSSLIRNAIVLAGFLSFSDISIRDILAFSASIFRISKSSSSNFGVVDSPIISTLSKISLFELRRYFLLKCETFEKM